MFVPAKDISNTTAALMSASAALFAIPASFQLNYLRNSLDKLREEAMRANVLLTSLVTSSQTQPVVGKLVSSLLDSLLLLCLRPKRHSLRVLLVRDGERLRMACRGTPDAAHAQVLAEAIAKVVAISHSLDTDRDSWLLWCLAAHLSVLCLIFRDACTFAAVLNIVIAIGALAVAFQLRDFTRRGALLPAKTLAALIVDSHVARPHVRKYIRALSAQQQASQLVPRLLPLILGTITSLYAFLAPQVR